MSTAPQTLRLMHVYEASELLGARGVRRPKRHAYYVYSDGRIVTRTAECWEPDRVLRGFTALGAPTVTLTCADWFAHPADSVRGMCPVITLKDRTCSLFISVVDEACEVME